METSFLSKNVKQLICEVDVEPFELAAVPNDHLQHPQGTIHWHALHHAFKDLHELPSNYTEHVNRLKPICASISNWVQKLTNEDFKHKYWDNLQWTGQQEVFIECFEVLQSKSVYSTHVSVLLSTAALERALGDIYLTKSRACPAMLKDLLVTPQLNTMIGPTAIKVLHILIGPPTSLNLRNIFWHGFASPGEIPIMYAYFLLVLTASLGEVLNCDHALVQLPHRPLLKFSNINQTKVVEVIENVEKNLLMYIVKNSDFIPKSMICIWVKALEYFYEGRYGLCVMLFIPQLEMAIRRLFVRVNDCPQRLITAESSVLFTTFDEMLCLQLEDKRKNALLVHVGEPHMEMLMDLLVYKDGARLRNHLSHGEMNFYQVDKDIADFVIYICFSWSCLFAEKECTDPMTVVLIESLRSNGKAYKSIYHPKVILKRGLAELYASLKQWQSIPLPKADQLECEHTADAELTARVLHAAQLIHYNCGCSSELERNELPTHDLSSLESFSAVMHLSTLFRPKIELEVTALLQKIIDQCVCISRNVIQITRLRYKQLLKKELRSRQRKNYTVLLSSIPTISSAILVVSMIVVTQLYQSSGLSDLTSSQQLSLIKFLKQVLQFTENMATNTSIEKNKWTDGLTLVALFLEKVFQFYDKET